MRLKGSSPGSPEGAVYGGLPGRAATVAVGSTTTGSAGSAASVVNSGSTNAAVLDFTVPRGDVGPQGAPGTAGSATIAGIGEATYISRKVADIGSAGTVGWVKVASFSVAGLQYKSFSAIYSFLSADSNDDSAIVAMSVGVNALGSSPYSNIDMLAKGGGDSNKYFADGFKVISGGSADPIEFWVKLGVYAVSSVYELSRRYNLVEVNYHSMWALQTSEPVGSLLNNKTNGVTAFGVPVVTTTGVQALTNKTLTSPVINAPKTSGLYDPSYGSLALSINPAHANPEGYLEIRPSSGEPQLRAMGTGANQNLALYTKGTGTLRVYTDNASAVPTIEGTNGTANSSLNLKTFGTGNVLVNGNLVPSAVAIPATVTTAGKQGQIAFNSSFLYVCVTDNNWRRVALTSW